MAKGKGKKPVVEKKVKEKSSVSSRKEKRIKRAAEVITQKLNEITESVETQINGGVNTLNIRNKIMELYGITKSTANCIIKRVRKNLGIYSFGDLPKTIKERVEKINEYCREKSIDNCPSIKFKNKKGK